MTVTVRCFARAPLNYAAVNPKSRDTAGTLILPEPYLAKEAITASTAGAVNSSTALAVSGAALLQVQIDGSAEVHIRITKSGSTSSATTTCPVYSGDVLLDWGPGYSLSVLEKS